jgi:paraquat-inducible protein B
MSTPANHWKLGLFVVLGIVISVAALVYFGERTLRKEVVAYKTFFDESVQGLETGAPVTFRGVSIGHVVNIDLAGDKRHVAVTYELGVSVLNELGLAAQRAPGARTRLVIPSDLRVQLASNGLTGVKFIQMDFFDEKTNPPLPLPFKLPDNYIPAAPSMMKNLEVSVVQAVERFPALTERLDAVLAQLANLVASVDAAHLPERLAEVVAVITKVLEHINGALVALDPGALSKDAQRMMQSLGVTLTAVNQVLARVDGDKGLAVSLHRTSEALGSMAQGANHVGPALEDALRSVQAAAVSVDRLASQLEHDPDMLLKGRAKRSAR